MLLGVLNAPNPPVLPNIFGTPCTHIPFDVEQQSSAY